jgi:hypothetical protein
MKRAYGLRSKFLHGDVIQASAVSELAELVPVVDNLLRRVLQRLAMNDDLRSRLEASAESREALFEDLVFGAVAGA